MPHPFLNSLIAFVTRRKRSCQLKIDQGEEEEEERQNGMEIRGTSSTNYHLPDELMIENILTRLPVRTLAVCCCVSKLWYNSTLNDSRFSVIHYNQNKNKESLVLNLLNVSRDDRGAFIHFFSLLGRENVEISVLSSVNVEDTYELVGYCNGLTCMKLVTEPNDTRGLIIVLNPNRGESLVLTYLLPTGGYICMCHGFGFDSLSQVYKVVIVFTSKANMEYLCMVSTLGTMKWRKIVTSFSDISPTPVSSLFHGRMFTRTSSTLCRQSTICGGDLFWRTKNQARYTSDSEMLLSFDLHNEKIHFVRLPAECTLTTPTYERQYLADDHLLEFRGYLCFARSERVTRSNNDHCGHRCNYQTSVCCCCCKVHMYILTDKEKQVWRRVETYDVRIMDQESLLPTPLCCYFDASAATPPTRILTSSDQVLLYWFNGERLILYNLQEKHLKVVECSLSYPGVFQTKMNENLERRIGDDDNIYCPSMDYQLRSQVENIVSLKTFVPKETKISESDRADVIHPLDNSLVTGWLTTGRITGGASCKGPCFMGSYGLIAWCGLLYASA